MNPIGLIYHVYLIIEDPKLEATTSNRSNVSRLLLVAELELEWSREKRCFALPLELREKNAFQASCTHHAYLRSTVVLAAGHHFYQPDCMLL